MIAQCDQPSRCYNFHLTLDELIPSNEVGNVLHYAAVRSTQNGSYNVFAELMNSLSQRSKASEFWICIDLMDIIQSC